MIFKTVLLSIKALDITKVRKIKIFISNKSENSYNKQKLEEEIGSISSCTVASVHSLFKTVLSIAYRIKHTLPHQTVLTFKNASCVSILNT